MKIARAVWVCLGLVVASGALFAAQKFWPPSSRVANTVSGSPEGTDWVIEGKGAGAGADAESTGSRSPRSRKESLALASETKAAPAVQTGPATESVAVVPSPPGPEGM